MLEQNQFKALEQASAESFFQQKNIIKKVLAGKKINCQKCQNNLSFKVNEISNKAEICCIKGCTSIDLDLA